MSFILQRWISTFFAPGNGFLVARNVPRTHFLPQEINFLPQEIHLRVIIMGNLKIGHGIASELDLKLGNDAILWGVESSTRQ